MAESLKITWDESLSTGVRLVDVQHKYLIDIINELAGLIEESTFGTKLGGVINMLKHYTEWHFGREELCMEKHQCPVAAKNKAAHAHFMEVFEEFETEYRASGGSEAIARQMYSELTQWLVGHIKGVDGELRGCVHAET